MEVVVGYWDEIGWWYCYVGFDYFFEIVFCVECFVVGVGENGDVGVFIFFELLLDCL